MVKYLGDSVYVRMENGMIKLFTKNFDDQEDNVIFLEPSVLNRLNEFYFEVTRIDREQKKLEGDNE
jgi:hypothetical protein